MGERKELEGSLINNLYNRKWCVLNRIDYVDPDVAKARNETYKEMVKYGLIEERSRKG